MATAAERQRLYRQRHPDRVKKRKRLYEAANREMIRKRERIYRANNRAKINQQQRNFAKSHPAKMVAYRRKFYLSNKSQILKAQKAYYELNKPRISIRNRNYRLSIPIEKRRSWSNNWARNHPEYAGEWRRRNLGRARLTKRLYARKRRATPKGALDHRMSSAVLSALKENKAGRQWEQLVGFTLYELVSHIGRLFTKGMTWQKLVDGEIHIDHVVPKAKFSYTKPEDIDFKRCWALSNLRPMWAKQNISKGDRILEPSQVALGL